MKSMKKNLIFWIITYEKMVGGILLGLAVYFGTLGIMGGGFTGGEVPVVGMVGLLLTIGIFSGGYASMVSYFSQTVAMGTTRKASFIAMQIAQHIMVTELLLVGAVAYYMQDREGLMGLLKIGTSIMGGILIIMALSNLVCCCFGKISKAVAMVLYIAGILLGVVILVMCILSDQINGVNVLERGREFLTKPYLLIGGILADGITIGMYYLIIRKLDLQF